MLALRAARGMLALEAAALRHSPARTSAVPPAKLAAAEQGRGTAGPLRRAVRGRAQHAGRRQGMGHARRRSMRGLNHPTTTSLQGCAHLATCGTSSISRHPQLRARAGRACQCRMRLPVPPAAHRQPSSTLVYIDAYICICMYIWWRLCTSALLYGWLFCAGCSPN